MHDWLRLKGRPLGQLRGVYVVAFILFVVLHLMTLHLIREPAGYYLASGMLVALALLLRFPMVGTILLGVLGSIYNSHPSLDGITYVATYAPIIYFVARRENRRAALYAGVQIVASIFGWLLNDALFVIVGTSVFIVFAWTIGFTLRIYDERVRAEGERADQASTLAKLEAAEFAREIAREMHDAVAHSMSSVVLKARAAALRPGLSEESKRELEEITELSIQSLGEMRSLLRLLRGATDETGRYRDYKIIDLAQEAARIEEFLQDQRFEVRMVIDGDFDTVDPLATSTFVSCIREASANVVRHGSDEKPVMITISADHEQISLAFINTIDQERHSIFPASGLGLIGIRERIEAIGGSLTSQQVGERWLLNFSIPKRIGAQQQGEFLDVE